MKTGKKMHMVRFGLLLCAAGIVLAGIVSWIYEYIASTVQA